MLETLKRIRLLAGGAKAAGKLCKEWVKDESAMVKFFLANGGKAGDGLLLVDKDGVYSPDNCRVESYSDEETEAVQTQRQAEQWDKTVAWFKERLAAATPESEERLVRSIRGCTYED